MKAKILSIINEYHSNSNGKCGITAVSIADKLGVPYSEIRNDLIELHSSNAFKVRPGINSILLFKTE